MRIKRIYTTDGPDINLIPLIDVLLVIVIFLVVSTTFMQPRHLEINLPGTHSAKEDDKQNPTLRIQIGRDGNYAFNSKNILNETQLHNELKKVLSSSLNKEDKQAILEADAAATHQSVVTVMDILASLGITRVSISASGSKK